MSDWVNELGPRRDEILQRLSKESVLGHENIRIADNRGPRPNAGQQQNLGYVNQLSGVGQSQSVLSGAGGRKQGEFVQTESTGTYVHTSSSYAPPAGPPPVPAFSYPESVQSFSESSYSGGAVVSGGNWYAPPPGPPYGGSYPAFPVPHSSPSDAPAQLGYSAQGDLHNQSGGYSGP